jgi:hypothetical protein
VIGIAPIHTNNISVVRTGFEPDICSITVSSGIRTPIDKTDHHLTIIKQRYRFICSHTNNIQKKRGRGFQRPKGESGSEYPDYANLLVSV